MRSWGGYTIWDSKADKDRTTGMPPPCAVMGKDILLKQAGPALCL